jgi:hypothetical protein
MPTLLEYFNNDFALGVSLDSKRKFTFQKINEHKRVVGQGEIEILERIHLHAATSVRLPTYYIPFDENTFDIICETLKILGKPNPNSLNLDFIVGFTGDIKVGNEKTRYTSRVYFYIENLLKDDELQKLDKICKSKDIFITLRSAEYVKIKMNTERPKAFISHDSRDKDLIAKNVAQGLSSRLCPVWYDEYSLKIGDSLRESIEKGIKEAHKCVLILTPNYLNNSGWGKTEFNSIFTRELIKNEKVVLPIWYGVTKEQVYDYSPSLVDTFALTWPTQENKTEAEYKQEVEQLISRLHTALTEPTV